MAGRPKKAPVTRVKPAFRGAKRLVKKTVREAMYQNVDFSIGTLSKVQGVAGKCRVSQASAGCRRQCRVSQAVQGVAGSAGCCRQCRVLQAVQGVTYI